MAEALGEGCQYAWEGGVSKRGTRLRGFEPGVGRAAYRLGLNLAHDDGADAVEGVLNLFKVLHGCFGFAS